MKMLVDIGSSLSIVLTCAVPKDAILKQISKSLWNTLAGTISTYSAFDRFIYIPELQKNMKINTKLHIVPKNVNCPYDIILGLDILCELGIKIDCLKDTIEWNGATTKFKSLHELKLHDYESLLQESDTPELIKKAENAYD